MSCLLTSLTVLKCSTHQEPVQTPVTILDMERIPGSVDMFLPMADPCPTCGGFNMRVGDWACYSECWWCNEKAESACIKKMLTHRKFYKEFCMTRDIARITAIGLSKVLHSTPLDVKCAAKMADRIADALRQEDCKLADMEARKDAAYLERNQCVALIARMALDLGCKAGVATTAIEGWSEDWHGCVYIDLPAGQVSWHFHDSQAYLFKRLPSYQTLWDGHDTPEKYRRVEAAFAVRDKYDRSNRK